MPNPREDRGARWLADLDELERHNEAVGAAAALPQTLGVKSADSWIYITFDHGLELLPDYVMEALVAGADTSSALMVAVLERYLANRGDAPLRISAEPYRESPTNLLLVDLEAHQVHACTPAEAPTPYHTWALDKFHGGEVSETLIPGSSARYDALQSVQERVDKARRVGHLQLVQS